MENELKKELEQRGTAEFSSGGIITQVTQALNEIPSEVEYLIFGKLQKQAIIPIAVVCAKCDFWENKFSDITTCQQSQKKDAEARGFFKMICPNQFVE